MDPFANSSEVNNLSETGRIGRRLRKWGLRLLDPKQIPELAGERVVFHHLKSAGFLDGLERKRVLEIGPKHGKDSLLLSSLGPSELVLIDLPEKHPMIERWLPQIPCHKAYVQGNILYLAEEEYAQLGSFDLVWCLGVLYHNVEQLRLIKRLYDLCEVGGKVVVESATTRNRKLEKLNVVEIYWPDTYRGVPTITHIPSRLAIKSWFEMVGFREVKIWDIYSRKLARVRAVLTGVKQATASPYVYYDKSNLNPSYIVGDAK
jgi:2-polyprenyl-3-methyl-5-hydroxy-6-metoxy-1,4-benzoquinol methylase